MRVRDSQSYKMGENNSGRFVIFNWVAAPAAYKYKDSVLAGAIILNRCYRLQRLPGPGHPLQVHGRALLTA